MRQENEIKGGEKVIKSDIKGNMSQEGVGSRKEARFLRNTINTVYVL